MRSAVYTPWLRASALALTLLWSAGANAGLFDDDEARRDIKKLREQTEAQTREFNDRLQRLDDSVKNLGIIQLLNQIEQQNSEIARLRGQIEVMTNENELLTKRQKDFYLDIDARLRKLEAGGASSSGVIVPPPTTIGSIPPPMIVSSPATPNPTVLPPAVLPGAPIIVPAAPPTYTKEQENKAYDAGSNAFRRGDFTAAVRAFDTFLADFPGSQLAANAQYWIGISYFNLKDYPRSRAAQELVLKRYPDSPKVPDAMLAIASVQQETGDVGSARNTLSDIISQYPSSEAAAKARTRLAQLRR